MSSKLKLILVPWDPDSVAHRSCLLRQREECSWGQDKVEIVWREQQIKGDKCIYWIVSPFPVRYSFYFEVMSFNKENLFRYA